MNDTTLTATPAATPQPFALTNPLGALALSVALGAAFATMPAAAQGVEKERCFGVALKGKNDCAAGATVSCAGTAKADHLGDTWLYVPKGSCEKIASKTSPTKFGRLEPFEVRRDASQQPATQSGKPERTS